LIIKLLVTRIPWGLQLCIYTRGLSGLRITRRRFRSLRHGERQVTLTFEIFARRGLSSITFRAIRKRTKNDIPVSLYANNRTYHFWSSLTGAYRLLQYFVSPSMSLIRFNQKLSEPWFCFSMSPWLMRMY